MFYLCCERYTGSRRASRTWIIEAEERPDTPDENNEVAYPFNGIGGEVVRGFGTSFAADMAEDYFWERQ